MREPFFKKGRRREKILWQQTRDRDLHGSDTGTVYPHGVLSNSTSFLQKLIQLERLVGGNVYRP